MHNTKPSSTEPRLAAAPCISSMMGSTPVPSSSRPLCPSWTVKGIALHVLGDDLSLLSRQRDEATNGLITFAAEHPGLGFRQLLDGFNEQWVHAATFLSEALVVELLRLTGEWTARYYSDVDPDARGEPVGFFGARGPSPYWQISAREYMERWIHQHQVRRAAGLSDLGEPFLHAAAGVGARSLAANLTVTNDTSSWLDATEGQKHRLPGFYP